MSIFYNPDLFHLGPQSLLAFCCNSGAYLGPEFKKLDSRTFLGFSEEIYFIIAEGECTNWWKRIFHSLALEVICNEKVTLAIRDIAEKQYDEAYNHFRYGEGKKNEYAPLMTAFLYHQRMVLRVLGE
jgi:hypothetical protein